MLARIPSFLTTQQQSIGWMFLWSASITTAMSLAKTLHSDTSGFVLVFLRCSFGFLFTLPFIAASGIQTLKTNRHKLHSIRVLFNCSAMACTYYAYRHLPLAEASAIGLSEPLLTTLMAGIILKDRVSLAKWLTIIGGYIGVLIVANPTNFFVNHALLVLLFANFSASVNIICTKMLSSTESTVLILMYTNIVSVIVTGMAAIPNWHLPQTNDLFIMVGVGFFGILSQLSYVRALKLGNPSFLSPFEYTRFVIAIPVGYFMLRETPTLQSLIGGSLIILATYWLTRIEAQEKA